MNIEIAQLETEIKATWEEAIQFCFSLGKGWRLPTSEELEWIAEFDKISQYSKSPYWTSTEHSESQAVVKYMVGIMIGDLFRFKMHKTAILRVIPVRELDI